MKHTNSKSSSKPSTTTATSITPTITTVLDVVPMEVDAVQVGRGKLMQEEHDRCFKNNLCLYCGEAGHRADSHKNLKLDQGKAKPESK